MATPQERRLQNETRQLNRKKAELAKQEEKIRNAKLEIEREKRALETQKREWKNKRAKFAQQMNRQKSTAVASTPTTPSSRRRGFSNADEVMEQAKMRKLTEAAERLKRENTEQAASIRSLRRDYKNLQRDNRVLAKQLAGKSRQIKTPTAGDEYLVNLSRAQVKRMKIELKIAKKKIMKLLKSCRVRKRYYGRQINKFKREENEWKREREERFESERVIVKHQFVDQVRKIKLSRGENGAVTLITDDGEVVIYPEKVVLSRDDGDDVEDVDAILGNIDLDDVDIDDEDLEDSDDSEDDDDAKLDDDDLEAEMDEDTKEEEKEEESLEPTPVLEPIPSQPGKDGYFVDDEVVVKSHGDDHGGIVRFVGETEQSDGEIVFGIELTDGSLGDCSGMVGEKQYFECPDMRGIFVKEIRRKMRQKDKEEFAARREARAKNEELRRSSSTRNTFKRPSIDLVQPEDFDRLAELLNEQDREAQQQGLDELMSEIRSRGQNMSEADSRDDTDESAVNAKFANFVELLNGILQDQGDGAAVTEREKEFFLREAVGRLDDVNRLREIFADTESDQAAKQLQIEQLVEGVATRHAEMKEADMPDVMNENNESWREALGGWKVVSETLVPKSKQKPRAVSRADSGASTPASRSRRGSTAKRSKLEKKRKRKKKVAWHVGTMITQRLKMFSDADLEEV